MSPVDRGFPFGRPRLAGLLFLSRGVAYGAALALAMRSRKSATKKPPEGGYLVQWSQRPGSNR